MQDSQANIDYWTQAAFNWRLCRQSISPAIALIGDSRTMALNSPPFEGRLTLNMGLSGARISTLMNYTHWQIPLIQPGLRGLLVNIGINNAPLPQNDPEFLNFAVDYQTLVITLQSFGIPVILSTIVPYETASPTMTSTTLIAAATSYANIVANFNAAIRSIAAARGCQCIDLAAYTTSADGTAVPGTTIDQTHYSSRGSAVVLSLMNQVLATTLG